MYALPLRLSYDMMDTQTLLRSSAGAQGADAQRITDAAGLDYFDVDGYGYDDRGLGLGLGLEGGTSFSYTCDGVPPPLSSLRLGGAQISTSRDFSQPQHHQHQAPSLHSSSSSDPNPDPPPRPRHKCTPTQLSHLSSFFHSTSRNPTGAMRAELAERLEMPERSVQTWFQNRRAKMRGRKGVGEGKQDEGLSKSVRADESPMEGGTTLSTCMPAMNLEGHASSLASPMRKGRRRKVNALESGFESITLLPSSSLTIGTWHRVQPLVCFFSRNARTLVWTLKSGSVGFKLEIPWASIGGMSFRGPFGPAETEAERAERADGVSELMGVLCVTLARAPIFSMEVFRSASRPAEPDGQRQVGARWRQCEDFTEGRQGTSVLTHVLSGPFAQLREAVLMLKGCHPDLEGKTHMLDEVSISSTQLQHSRSLVAVPQQAPLIVMGGTQQQFPLQLQQTPAELPADTSDLDFYGSSVSAGFAPSHDFSSASVETSPTQLFFVPQTSTSGGCGLDISLDAQTGRISMHQKPLIAPSYGVEQTQPLPRPTPSQPHWLGLPQKEQQQQQQWQHSSAPLRPAHTHSDTYVQLFESLPTEAQARQCSERRSP